MSKERRLAAGLGMAAILSLFAASTVYGKLPYVTVELTPAQPVRGQTVAILVRTWEDTDHTVPAQFSITDALDGLLVLRATDGTSSDIPVPLERASTDVFTGSVTVPLDGAWDLVAFPDRSGWGSPEVPAGYPDKIPITGQPSTGALPLELIIAALATFSAAVTLLALRVRTRRTTPHHPATTSA
jgi:hypothetical protein